MLNRLRFSRHRSRFLGPALGFLLALIRVKHADVLGLPPPETPLRFRAFGRLDAASGRLDAAHVRSVVLVWCCPSLIRKGVKLLWSEKGEILGPTKRDLLSGLVTLLSRTFSRFFLVRGFTLCVLTEAVSLGLKSWHRPSSLPR